MPPPWRPGDPAVVSRPMHTTEGGAAASVSEPADTPDERLDAPTREHRDRRRRGRRAGRRSGAAVLDDLVALARRVAERQHRPAARRRPRPVAAPRRPPAALLPAPARLDRRSSAPATSPSGPSPGCSALLTLPLAWIAGRRRGGPLLGWIAVTVVRALAVRRAVLRRGPHVLDGHVPGLRRVPPARRRRCAGARTARCASSGSWPSPPRCSTPTTGRCGCSPPPG